MRPISLLLPTLVSTLPTLVFRSCTTLLPTAYQPIFQTTPFTSFPHSRNFTASRTATPGYATDTLLHFTGIPAGAYGCQLAVSFTFDYPIASSGSTLLNVYKTDIDISVSSDYATYYPDDGEGPPSQSFLFGTTALDGGQHVINSAACAPDMSFVVGIASKTQAGSVSFVDAGDNLSGFGGFYMTFDC